MPKSLDVISDTLLESLADYSYDTCNPASLVSTNCTSHAWDTQTHIDQGKLSELSISSPSYSDLLGEYLLANQSNEESEELFCEGKWNVLLLRHLVTKK